MPKLIKLARSQREGPLYLIHSINVKGWILLSKEKPHDRYLSLLEPGEEPEFVIEQDAIRQKPYQQAKKRGQA